MNMVLEYCVLHVMFKCGANYTSKLKKQDLNNI